MVIRGPTNNGYNMIQYVFGGMFVSVDSEWCRDPVSKQTNKAKGLRSKSSPSPSSRREVTTDCCGRVLSSEEEILSLYFNISVSTLVSNRTNSVVSGR